MSTVWRLHLKSGKDERFDYCIDNNVAAIGWRITNDTYDRQMEISNIAQENFDKFCSLILSKYNDSAVKCIKRFRYAADCEGDLIWTRRRGKYYLARISAQTEWIYNSDERAYNADSCIQLTNIVWYPVGDESDVPGAVANAFIKGSSFQRIHKEGIDIYSKYLYDKLSESNYYENNTKILNDAEQGFYSFLTPSDCEDLLCLWLLCKYNYICIPSTNKLSTPLYECVLINPQNGSHVYVQVKQGDTEINVEDYLHLNGEVWLFSTKNRIKGAQNENIHTVTAAELYEFALNEKTLITDSIKRWADLCQKMSS